MQNMNTTGQTNKQQEPHLQLSHNNSSSFRRHLVIIFLVLLLLLLLLILPSYIHVQLYKRRTQ